MGPGIASLRYVDGLQVLGEGVLHRHAAGAVGCKLFIGQEGRVVLSSNRVDVDSPSDNNLLLPAILPLRVPTRFDFPPGLGIVARIAHCLVWEVGARMCPDLQIALSYGITAEGSS